jgi:hypothetical protein
MITPVCHFAATTELSRRIVDEKLGNDGQQRRRLPIPLADQPGQESIQIVRIAPAGPQR